MQNPLTAIQLLVAPVVMISANGLLCLALYNRLAAIVTRARTFHKERFDVLGQLSAMPLEDQTMPRAHRLRLRTDTLDQQIHLILKRARLIRSALLLLLAAVLCMLLCSIALGLTLLSELLVWVPLVTFTMGVLAMIGGVLMAMIELQGALDPVTLESSTPEDKWEVKSEK